MKDRYLCKAKRADNGEWVIGNLITNAFFRLGQSIPYILCHKAEYDCFEDFTVFEVQPDTICQCTGLKDKNGKLIWENDYLKSFDGDGDDWEISKVVFGEDSLGVGWHEIGIKSLSEYNCKLFDVGLSRYDASKREIIGNIFDNKDLLDGGIL